MNNADSSESTIRQGNDGWYWADEVWHWHGPLPLRETAQAQQALYAADLMGTEDAQEHSMALQITDRRPGELVRGQARRVPQDLRRGLIGYHVCCPRCGYVTIAIVGVCGLTIVESDVCTVVTFSAPLRCAYCRVLIAVANNELQLIDDEYTLNIRQR